MKDLQYLHGISHLMSIFSNDVKYNNSMGLFDINIVGEKFAQNILSILFDCHNLKLMNQIKCNYPAIDLADQEKKISIQVTSNGNLSKVQSTLKMFLKKKLNQRYDKLYIYIINDTKKNNYPSNKINQILEESNFYFDTKTDVFDNSDLVKAIYYKSFEDIEKIFNYLNKQYGEKKSVENVYPININANFHLPLRAKNYIEKHNNKYYRGFIDNNSEELYISGNKYLQEKNHTKSKEYFNKSIETLNKNISQVLTDNGVNYCYEGDIEKGVDEFEKALELNPKNPEIRYNLGFSYFKLNRFIDSIKELEISIELKSSKKAERILIESSYELFEFNLNKGNLNNALLYLEKILKIKPNDENSLINKAIIKIELEKLELGINILKGVINKNKKSNRIRSQKPSLLF